MNKEYNIICFRQNGIQTIVKRGVSLAEAQRICEDEETSSMTARKPKGCNGDEEMQDKWHKAQKHWFYGFREVKL